MFPYPSGEGLHVGHVESYTATDIISRYYRLNGYNVLHPQGFDAFGLPAENYAIKTGIHPVETTKKAIANFKSQMEIVGLSYDWSREINTADPDYYKWTQWIFLQLYKKGLAYKKKAPVNWCENCKTVLANEQVVNGLCERCENKVIQKDLEQWFFKITEYAEELLNDIEKMDWPEALKHAQKNWIGKSEGALIKFQVPNSKLQTNSNDQITNNQNYIEVFTTRPDTLFGATYLVVAPEHEIINNLLPITDNQEEVEEYINISRTKNKLERTDLAKEKTGVELKGVKAINPGSKEEIPIWIADYVLTDYGTGAIMAVPAHDERDFEFAKKYNLKIIEVVKSIEKLESKAYIGEGILINSDKFDGLTSEEAKDKITKFVGGKKQTQYKIRDWLISRQRYWGTPIPMIYCDKCGLLPVPEKDLPVVLPDDVDFKPTGESPLVRSKKFHQVKCPNCGTPARRESDTMDTFVCSSWYFLRYADPHNKKELASKASLKKWLPVDLYIGGMEHAVGHLIYARFMTKALADLGYFNFREPFLKIRNQGIILAEDSRKMSKRWGNVINPDDVVKEYGADTLRMYLMFMGPLEDMKPWDSRGIVGVKRFLDKVNNIVANRKSQIANRDSQDLEKLLHKTIMKVIEDIENLRFNTAISAMMIYINHVSDGHTSHVSNGQVSNSQMEKFLIILAPFAPYLTEELWEKLGHKETIFKEKWPEYDKKLVIDEQVTIAIQVNGKLRDTIEVDRGISEEDLRPMTYKLPNVKKYIEGREIKKFIYIKDRLVNIVV